MDSSCNLLTEDLTLAVENNGLPSVSSALNFSVFQWNLLSSFVSFRFANWGSTRNCLKFQLWIPFESWSHSYPRSHQHSCSTVASFSRHRVLESHQQLQVDFHNSIGGVHIPVPEKTFSFAIIATFSSFCFEECPFCLLILLDSGSSFSYCSLKWLFDDCFLFWVLLEQMNPIDSLSKTSVLLLDSGASLELNFSSLPSHYSQILLLQSSLAGNCELRHPWLTQMTRLKMSTPMNYSPWAQIGFILMELLLGPSLSSFSSVLVFVVVVR